MKREPDKTLVGVFVITALVLAVAAVAFFGSGAFLSKKNRFVLFFSHSVKGLSVGAPVVLGGVKIGSVRDIRIHADTRGNGFSIPVYIEIEEKSIRVPGKDQNWEGLNKNINALIRQGLRAQLEMQSLVTGQLLVSLNFHPDKPAVLHEEASPCLEIPTIESDIEVFARKIKQVPVQEIFAKLDTIMGAIEEMLIQPADGDQTASLAVILERFSALLHQVNQAAPHTLQSLSRLLEEGHQLMGTGQGALATLTDHLHGTLSDAQLLVRTANGQLETMGREFQDTARKSRTVMDHVNQTLVPLSRSLEKTAQAFETAADQARQTLGNMETVTAPESAIVVRLEQALEELSQAARSFKSLTQYLERHPEALLRGKQ